MKFISKKKSRKKTLEAVKIRKLYGRVFLTSLLGLGISDRSNYYAGERHKTAGLHALSCSRKIEFILCPCLHFLAIKMPIAPMSWRRWAISIKWRMLKNKALLYSA
jgi:hypothetical protein